MTLAKLSRGGAEHAETKYYYDGLSRPTRESQKIKGGAARNVDYAYDAAGNRTRLAYPGASRVVNYAYDGANRISLVKDGSNAVAQYLYVGGGRVSERKYMERPGSHLQLSFGNVRGTSGVTSSGPVAGKDSSGAAR